MSGIGYLKPTHIWPIKRCRLEFYNDETISGTEIYRSFRRYRFNKWEPLTTYVPTPTRNGLQFLFSSHQPLSGMMSSFDIPAGERCKATFTFSSIDYMLNMPTPIHTWMPPSLYTPLPAVAPLAEVGIGIQRYLSDYWHPVDGMELAIVRGYNYVDVLGLRSTRLRRWSSPGNHTAAKFEAFIDRGHFYVGIEEYDSSNNIVSSQSYDIPAPSGPTSTLDKEMYRITMFGRAKYATCDALLARTEITEPAKPYWGEREIVQFKENPETIEILDAQPRHPNTHIYPQPHTAYIEDGDIQCGSSWCDEQWFNIMSFLVDTTVEPFYFYDIEGRQWLCCFSDMTGEGRRGFLGRQKQGYTLTMPILVVH